MRTTILVGAAVAALALALKKRREYVMPPEQFVFSERPANVREVILDTQMGALPTVRERLPLICQWLISRSDDTVKMDDLLALELDVLFMVLNKALDAFQAGRIARGEIPLSELTEPKKPEPFVPDAFWKAFDGE